jgi:hypothetical protein
MRKTVQPLAVAMLMVSCCLALAEDPQAKQIVVPDTAAAAAAECREGMSECKLECKRMAAPLGTRIGGHTECRTHQYWVDRMREDQARTVKIQMDSFRYGPH